MALDASQQKKVLDYGVLSNCSFKLGPNTQVSHSWLILDMFLGPVSLAQVCHHMQCFMSLGSIAKFHMSLLGTQVCKTGNHYNCCFKKKINHFPVVPTLKWWRTVPFRSTTRYCTGIPTNNEWAVLVWKVFWAVQEMWIFHDVLSASTRTVLQSHESLGFSNYNNPFPAITKIEKGSKIRWTITLLGV